MRKKRTIIVIFIALVVFGVLTFKFNVYDTQFYSVCFGTGTIHTPVEIEEITYISFLVPELEGAIVLNAEEDLAMWDEFVTWLNNTEFKKVRSTWGRSYTGEGIYIKFKGVEEQLQLRVAHDWKSLKFGDYIWKTEGEIALPVDEAYLLEKKEEQKNNQ